MRAGVVKCSFEYEKSYLKMSEMQLATCGTCGLQHQPKHSCLGGERTHSYVWSADAQFPSQARQLRQYVAAAGQERTCRQQANSYRVWRRCGWCLYKVMLIGLSPMSNMQNRSQAGPPRRYAAAAGQERTPRRQVARCGARLISIQQGSDC